MNRRTLQNQQQSSYQSGIQKNTMSTAGNSLMFHEIIVKSTIVLYFFSNDCKNYITIFIMLSNVFLQICFLCPWMPLRGPHWTFQSQWGEISVLHCYTSILTATFSILKIWMKHITFTKYSWILCDTYDVWSGRLPCLSLVIFHDSPVSEGIPPLVHSPLGGKEVVWNGLLWDFLGGHHRCWHAGFHV